MFFLSQELSQLVWAKEDVIKALLGKENPDIESVLEEIGSIIEITDILSNLVGEYASLISDLIKKQNG